MLALAGSIASVLIGSLYAAASKGGPSEPAAEVTPLEETPGEPAPVPEGADVPPEAVALLEAEPGEIVDVEAGIAIGPLTVLRRGPVEPAPTVEAVTPTPVAPRAAARPARRATPAPPIPRLHPDPGRHVILTARRMMAQNQVVQGSCYRYISEVFARAGHEGWRNRRTVFGGRRNGPYADLDLIRPGDWLYIVNHPERTPVGTHSVLFVGWEDRARGYAHVIEHSGWGAPSAGQERGYDVSRTYRIIRPVN